MIESGLREFDIVLYSGVLAPRGLDPALVRRLNALLGNVVQTAEIKKVYDNLGVEPIALSPQEFESRTASEIAKLAPLVKGSGAKVD
jgi:tripartite-type tricarboxylate transporter receptor subunit TctC